MSGSERMYGLPEGVFRTNFSEIFAPHFAYNQQFWTLKMPCSDFQMNSIECVEAYGAVRGRRVCRKYLEDFAECMYNNKQMQRASEMRKERIRQVIAGKRQMKDLDGKLKPPCDSFQEGPFVPA